MATIIPVAVGGSEDQQVASVTTSYIPGDYFVAFVLSRYGLNAIQNNISNWTRLVLSNLGMLSVVGTANCFVSGPSPTTWTGTTQIIQSSDAYPWVSYAVFCVRPDNGKRIVLRSYNNSNFSTSTPSIAVPGETNHQSIVFGSQFVMDDVYFTDTDTTDGSWSGVTKHTSTGTDRALAIQYKFATGTSAQNYGGTMASSEYGNLTCVNFQEVENGQWGMKA